MAVTVGHFEEVRFAPIALDSASDAERPRRLELELAAPGERTGMGFDVAIAQRATFGSNNDGDLDREGQGQELRLGRGLGGERESNGEPAIYLFAASDDEALTWQPGAARNSFGGQGASFALQDRVEIGDMQAGVTYERGNMQASVAYVEREVSTQVYGSRSISQDESFTGFTFTMKR